MCAIDARARHRGVRPHERAAARDPRDRHAGAVVLELMPQLPRRVERIHVDAGVPGPQHCRHRGPDRLAIERIRGRGIEDHAVHAERQRVAEHAADVIGIGNPLESTIALGHLNAGMVRELEAGLDTALAERPETRHIPIVFLSARADYADLVRGGKVQGTAGWFESLGMRPGGRVNPQRERAEMGLGHPGVDRQVLIGRDHGPASPEQRCVAGVEQLPVCRAAAQGLLGGVPEVYARGQGGLLDVTLSPTFDKDKLVFLSFAEPGEGGAGTAVARGTLGDNKLDNVKVIWRQQPKVKGAGHFSHKIAFGPELWWGANPAVLAKYRRLVGSASPGAVCD